MGVVNIIDPTGEPVELAPGRGDLRTSSVPASQWFGMWGNSRGSTELLGGKTVSHARLVAEQPWIGAAISRILTWSIRVPLKVYRREDMENRVRLGADDHPLARALVEPWEGGSQSDLVQHLLGSDLVHGNGLAEVDEGARGTIRFEDTDWRTATPIKASWRRIAGWKIREDGDEREIGADQAIHTAWWSPLGPVGISPLRQLGTTVRLEDAAQRWQQSILKQSAKPPSALEMSDEFLRMRVDERAKVMRSLRGDVEQLYATPEGAGRPALLPPGITWNAVGHTAVEAELIRQRLVAREEMMGVYLLPPGTMGLFLRGGDELAEQRTMGYVDALAPRLILIEHALNAQLVRNLLRELDIYVEFDFAGILRGDRLKEIEALREAIASALLTPNEGRRIINEPQSDQAGMDDFYLPRNNLWPLSVPYPDQPPASRTQEES